MAFQRGPDNPAEALLWGLVRIFGGELAREKFFEAAAAATVAQVRLWRGLATEDEALDALAELYLSLHQIAMMTDGGPSGADKLYEKIDQKMKERAQKMLDTSLE